MDLPSIPELEKRCKALAFLEALLSPGEDEKWIRYFSFNQKWDDTGARMATFHDNYGSDFFILFTADGKAAIKGFDPMCNRADPDLVRAELPKEIRGFQDEPAFSMGEISFCMWNTGEGWVSSAHNDEDALTMLHLLTAIASEYVGHVQDNFERTMKVKFVKAAFALEPMDLEFVHRHCPWITDFEEIQSLDDIGYPITR